MQGVSVERLDHLGGGRGGVSRDRAGRLSGCARRADAAATVCAEMGYCHINGETG
jgi:hypothetical protein